MVTPRTHLMLGGARSGKTRRALKLARAQPRRVYLATAEALDEEMRLRITRHQSERDSTWKTIEEPLDLAGALVGADRAETAIVIDCLTVWLSNLMHAERDIDAATGSLTAAIAATEATLIFVSNEVGLGIVPDNALARAFRDAQGRLNQDIAAAVDHVDFVAAGLALNLKPGVRP